jgi:NitT/TauT family transport system ATP-binding protein
MAKIELCSCSFSYPGSSPQKTVLHNLNLQVQDGEFVCIIGPSGCGKSTLLRVLAGLERPQEGTVCINGMPITGPGTDRMIVFQDYALFPWMTALKNVQFALRHARNFPRRQAEELANSFLEKVGMGAHGKLYPFQMSGGMRQRVAIARALSMDTDILLLDEPFGALDAKIRRELQQQLLLLWQKEDGKKKTILFVTHDIEEAILLGDRVVFLQAGEIGAERMVDLPRPREKGASFQSYRQMLLALFEPEKREAMEE